MLSCSRETYNALTNWLTDARTLASPNIIIILCGNKKDLDADREVTFLEASRFAQENGNWCQANTVLLFEPFSSYFLCIIPCACFALFMAPYQVFWFFFCVLNLCLMGSVCRANVPGDERSDRRECGGGFPQVCPHHPQQDRLGYAFHSAHVCLFLPPRCPWVSKALCCIRCSCLMCVCFTGELDPERMGSGIQYGDASLRQLRQPRGTTTQNKQQCNC